MIGEIVLAAVFVIVLLVCLHVLAEMGFEGLSRAVLAFCVAMLSAVGVAQLALWPVGQKINVTSPNFEIDFILLAYAALGLSLLVLLLLVFLSRFVRIVQELRKRYSKSPGRASEKASRDLKQSASKRDSVGRARERENGANQK